MGLTGQKNILCHLINITITILDIIHGPVFYLKQHFGHWILSPTSGTTYSVGPNK
jgi:hypothetical protein